MSSTGARPTVRAAGGVLWRRSGGQLLVAVVHRPKYDDWSLPKGKLDDGELEVAGAVREVAEETGYSCVVGRGLGTTRYRVLDGGRDVAKTVRWWALQAQDGEFVPSAEVDEMRWLPVSAALRMVQLGRDDGVLACFAAGPADTSTVLLVRHARAGRRDRWNGPDDERPLDEVGRAQAQALAGLLPLWGPTAVRSAPALRCRQTVEPVAQRLGAAVEVDGALAEDADGLLPSHLRRLGAEGRTVVACSQGRAMTPAVAEVAAAAGLAVADPDAPKGAVWALSWTDGRLVDVDRTDLRG